MPFEVPSLDPCPFCEYVAGRLVTRWHGRDQTMIAIEDLPHTLALLHPDQQRPGWIFVITKRHAPTLSDLTDAEVMSVATHARRIARAVRSAFDPDGVNVFQNNGIAAGQSVGHYHVHVRARYKGDRERPTGGDPWGHSSSEERLQVAQAVQEHLPRA